MIQFPDPLCLTPIDGGFDWYLDHPFRIRDDVLGLLEIPANFRTDLGSIPHFLWGVIPPEGPATKGFLGHDWLYTKKPCTRAQADDFLLRAMKQLGVGWAPRYTVYWNLRAFGWVAWNSDARSGGPKFYVEDGPQAA